MESQNPAPDPLLQYLLVAAARRHHVEIVIRPHLQQEAWVLCDRFYDSSVVYQHYVQGLDLDVMNRIHQAVCPLLEPHITFVLDADPAVGLARAQTRQTALTWFDQQAVSFHRGVRQGFLDLAHKNPHRMVIIDATQSPEQVLDQIWDQVEAFLSQGTL
jgi:dTMP kinase